MTINVFTKNVFGQTKMYAAGQARATIRALTRRETIDESDVRALESMGHKVRIFDSEMMATAELAGR